jgi:tRNA(Ile)-lysidine synthase
MKDPILQEVKQFLEARHRPGAPVLVGFSGGPDSLALLHLLAACRRFLPLDLHLAHVDHGWRSESRKEAEKLKKEAALPFHLCRLKKNVKTEDGARKERLRFFAKLYKKLGCQALILAHHRDDQAETVLKRLLEGAHLMSLGGILPEAQLEGMAVWRPLLNVSKKELLAWVGQKGLDPILDPSNADPRYLRARMRTVIFPGLEKQFGKEIAGNLSRLGSAAQELKEYLDKKTDPYFSLLKREKGHVSIDLNPLYPFEKLELKAFLKKLSDRESLSLSYEALEILCRLLESGAFKKKIIAQGKVIEIHRRTIALKIDSR